MTHYCPHLLAVMFYGVAFVLAGLGWFLRRTDGRPGLTGTVALGLAIFLLPLQFPGTDVGVKAALLLCCVFPLKLWDAYADRDRWRNGRLQDWLAFLANPVALVYRRHIALNKPSLPQNLRGFARGLFEVAAGVALFRCLDRLPWCSFPFWLDHGLRLLASYLFIWDGGCVLFAATWRLLGFRCVEFSIHPILARTPADFWRRYNRWIGQFLYEDFFKQLGGLRRPVAATFCCFLVMGLLHEYLACVLTGRVTWHLPLFFLLHAVATVFTFRLRLTGLAAAIGMTATLAFHYFTSVLFFIRFHEIVGGWYLSS